MQAILPSSEVFASDQQVGWIAEYWDTPFTPLEASGDVAVASNGLIFSLTEPVTNGPWTLADELAGAGSGAAAIAAFEATKYNHPITHGRVPNAIDYWAGGAPGWYGSSQWGQVGIHIQGFFRDTVGRQWFSNASSVPVTLALSGNGYFRVDVNGVNKFNGKITETTYLQGGIDQAGNQINPGVQVVSLGNLTVGDQLDLFYVEGKKDTWGGYVFKAIYGDVSGLFTVDQQRVAQDAPILGCGLFDDGTPPTQQTLQHVSAVDIVHENGSASTCVLTVPLINTQNFDGTGWQFKRDTPSDPGYLQHWVNGVVDFTVKRGRLIRVSETVGVAEVYRGFLGLIDDFDQPSTGNLQIKCLGFERRLLDVSDKNYPDRIDYMSRTYTQRLGATQPVYSLPAFDNWPMEYAVEQMMMRGGIDASRLRRQLTVPLSTGTSVPVQPAGTVAGGEAVRKFWARTLNGQQLRLERPPHYGNYGQGFRETQRVDDPYVFKPEPTRELWARIREITERYGYDCKADEFGDFVLQPRNNPHYIYKINVADGGSPTRKTHPSSYEGTYMEYTGTPTVTKTVQGARIDCIMPRFAGAGAWTFNVIRVSDSAVVASGVADPSVAAGEPDEFFYDFRAQVVETNATLVTLWSGDYDTYQVQLTGATSGTRRLDSILMYHTDPVLPRYPVTFSTALNARSVQAESTIADSRNFVVVVGRRQAVITDSAKLDQNPNNPELEFAVSSAVDVGSVADPTASNYWGGVKESVIYDSNITDQDFADYLSRVFIFRYRTPQPGSNVDHTIVPVMELRDPVYVAEDRYQTIASTVVQFVKRIEHHLRPGSAITQFETTAMPEFPAYEPRNDIDIDADFRDSRPVPPGTGIGVPAVNWAISYVTLTGQTVTNLDSNAVHPSLDSFTTDDVPGDVVLTDPLTVQSGTPDFLNMTGQPWPPVPGTVYLTPANVPDIAGSTKLWQFGTTFGFTISDDPLTLNPAGYGVPGSPDTPWGGRGQPSDTGGIGGTNGPFTIGIAAGGQAVLNETFVNVQRIVSVVVQPFSLGVNHSPTSNPPPVGPSGPALTLGTNPTSGPLYYEVGGTQYANTITVRSSLPPTPAGFAPVQVFFAVQVTWIQGNQGTSLPYIANTPYHRFLTVDYTNKKILLPWEQGNGSSVYDRNALLTQFRVLYRRLGPTDGSGNFVDPYSGTSPFYDPYTSELGNLVTIQTDFLITGNYRVSVRSVFDPDTVVAWLTEPTADGNDPEAHWTFFQAGAAKQFFWDGVDNVGTWNQLMSQEYANDAHGAFEQDATPIIGDGFYSWNREQDAGAPGPFALIAGDRDGSGKPVFGQRTYSSWFVRLEATNDDLVAKSLQNPAFPGIRVVDSNSMDPALNNGVGETVVHMHLPDPTRVTLQVLDWNPTATPFNTTDYANGGVVHWNTSPDTDATINNFQPTNIRFTVVPRPGVLWDGLEGEVSVKLTRVAHLKRIYHDQFVIFDGSTYPDSVVPKATVVNRRLANDANTIIYQDTDYRQAKTFKNADNKDGVEWVFIPQYFAKDFRGIPQEPISFADYLQLEEVPSYDPTRAVSGLGSRLQIAFISDLFYLSAYTQDRSGRFVWGLNTSFVDKSKILNNSTPATWPDDLTHQHRRTIVCRNWTNELQQVGQSWVEYQRDKWSIAPGSTGDTLLRHKWSLHDPLSGNTLGLSRIDEYSSNLSPDTDGHDRLAWYGGDVQLSWTVQAKNRQLGNGDVGSIWTWETGPLWAPAITRDFHPYFLVPPLPDFALPINHADGDNNEQYFANYCYASVDSRQQIEDPASPDFNTGNDVAAGETWSSYTVDQTGDPSLMRFKPGTNVAGFYSTPSHLPPGKSIDYIRQDELQHFEDFRGIFSRKARPSEAPVKVTPILPYFINPIGYTHITKQRAFQNPAYVKFFAGVFQWFDYRFRHEYLWENGALFPCDDFGVENLKYANMSVSRVFLTTPAASQVKFDAGAWTGWKDDSVHSNFLGELTPTQSIFEWGAMPFAVSSPVPETRTPYFHMVLLNERRSVPVVPNTQALPSSVVGTVTITPGTFSVGVGGMRSITAQAIATDSTVLSTRTDFKWTVDDPSICSCSNPFIRFVGFNASNQTIVTGLKAGTTTIRASLDGVIGTATVTVT